MDNSNLAAAMLPVPDIQTYFRELNRNVRQSILYKSFNRISNICRQTEWLNK